MKWVKLGCLVVGTLVKTPDGSRYLMSEDDLLKELSECFTQFDPVSRGPLSDITSADTFLVEWKPRV